MKASAFDQVRAGLEDAIAHSRGSAQMAGGRVLQAPDLDAGARAERITSDQALCIARLDAEAAYRDLSAYRIHVSLERDGWHIDYELKDPSVQGGGPRYVIDPTSGKLLSKKYDQ